MKSITVFLALLLTSTYLFAQDIPTLGEIYDFEINDEFHYEARFRNPNYPGPEDLIILYSIVITDKYTSSDSLYYEYEKGTNPPELMSFSLEDLDREIIDPYLHDLESTNYYFRTRPEYYNNRTAIVLDYEYRNETYAVGCGLAHLAQFSLEDTTLVCYDKGTERWTHPKYYLNAPWASKRLSLSPVPVKHYSTLKLQLEEISKVSIFLVDVSGKVVLRYSENAEMREGRHEIDLDLSNLPTGFYFCQVKINGEMETVRFFK